MELRARRGTVLVVLAVVGLLAAVVAGVAFSRQRETGRWVGTESDGSVPLGERVGADERAPLPARTLAAFGDGAPVDLTAYRGRPLVVNFWATWCAPCVEEMPEFQEVFAELGGEVAFLGVDVQDGPRRAEPFAEELGITYDLAVDPAKEFSNEVGVFAMPTTLFVDAEGTIVHRTPGVLTGAELRAALRTHLSAAA